MEIIFLVILLLFLVSFFSVLMMKKNKPKVNGWEITLLIFYILSFLPFSFGIMVHAHQYTEAIDPIDPNCYIPFGDKHFVSLLVYFVLYHISGILIWIKGRKLPPLTLVLSLVLLFIGLILNFFVIIQIMGHNTETIDAYKGNDGTPFMIFTPLISFLIAFLLIGKIINEEKTKAETRIYKNKFLNFCNQFLSKRFDESVWAIVLLFPVLLVITAILIIFGQDYNSLIKVFTDTTTWTFSQKMHPPTLDHTGHYLCTVAAKGNPKIVKPIKIGKRQGKPIIINRQLQIANAFEEKIQEISPKTHQFIRRNYDKYGYNLSIKINSESASNLTYILMKPLEWTFLIFLYLFCQSPETKIKKQYS